MAFWTWSELVWLAEMFIRLLAATILGGLVGYEREHANRPAGFRTHILVSLGAALVMVTAEFVFRKYSMQANLDPTRMGAQVISGIGFLGAGTIIRTGNSVKGLTTAASLWAVSCIGLACGSGFYLGAILATLFTFLTLIALKRLEKHLAAKHGDLTLLIHLNQYGQDVLSILAIAEEMNLAVRKLQLLPEENDDQKGVHLRLTLAKVLPESKAQFLQKLYKLPTVLAASDE